MGFWPFKKRQQPVDLALEAMPRAVYAISEKWSNFSSLPQMNDWTLLDKMTIFLPGVIKGLGQWKAYAEAPESIFLIITALAIECSGTYSRAEIEQALSVEMPENPYLKKLQ